MFKKAIEAKSQQRLSGADRKKLKRTIKDRFPNASDPDIDLLIPPKVEITVAKYPSRVLVYGLEGGFPMFFDIDGRGTEIFPTIYSLWMVPELLPAFILKGGEVSRFVIGGADLMFPGISIPSEGLPSFSAGVPCAVKVPGNPAPIAVGTTTMSSSEALKAGLRGKALRIHHYFGDSLRDSVDGHYVPKAGFFEDVVLEDPSLFSAGQASDACEGDTPIDEEIGTDNKEMMVEAVDGKDSYSNPDPAVTTFNDSKNDVPEKVTADVHDLKISEIVAADEPIAEEQHIMTTEDIDALLDKCLLQALHSSVKDKHLPVSGSTLWSGHVLTCRPSGITLDIKKSSHKKLSKWLQSKSSSGLITVKEDKHKKEVMLCAIHRNHPDYTSFKPEKRKVEKIEQSSDHGASGGRSHKVLEVVEVYKPSVHVNPIFSEVGADMGKLFTASEAVEVVFSYIEKENLVKPANKPIVVLNANLSDALFKGAIKKGSTYPTEIHKKDLVPTFINRMQAHHKVTRGNDSVVGKGTLKNIQIASDREEAR